MKVSFETIVVAAGLTAICGWGLPSSFGAPPADPYQAPFEKMSGSELVQKLADEKTRTPAFYELHRRNDGKYERQDGSEKDVGYELFLQAFYGVRVIPVPQADGAPPFYLVTFNGSRFIYRSDILNEGMYRVPRCEELFPPIAEPPQRAADDSGRDFQLFDDKGE